MLQLNYLKNGIEYLIKDNSVSSLVCIQAWVKAGSLHEKSNERGLAHLIEHMLFKGTEKRGIGEIASTIEECGGDINAYTTFDRTVYYLTLPAKHLEVGLEILADAVFSSSFDISELEKEKEVVCEEIRRSLDNPAAKVGHKIFEYVFKGTEAERPIIGFLDQVKQFSREDVLHFYKKWYVPENVAVVVVGDVHQDSALKLIEKYFGNVFGGKKENFNFPQRTFPENIKVELLKGDYAQPRLEIAFEAPPLDDVNTVALDIAAFALGYGDSCRLNRILRDKEGIVSSITANLYSPKFGGIVEISAFPTLEKYTETVESIIREVLVLKYHKPVDEEELEKARANIKVNRIYEEETMGGMAKTLGFGLTTPLKQYFEDVYMTLVNKVEPKIIATAVRKWIDENKFVVVGLVSKDSSLTEQDIKDAIQKGIIAGVGSKKQELQKTSGVANKSKTKPKIISISDNVKLIFKQNPNTDLVQIVAAAEGGLRFENEKNAGIYNAASGMLGKANKKLNYENLLKLVEGSGAILEGFSGKDSFGLKMQCIKEQLPTLSKTFFECFLNPVFPKEQWETLKLEIFEDIKSENDSPSNICIRKFQELRYGDHPYRFPVYGLKNSVTTFNQKILQEKYTEFRDAKNWIISCVAPCSEDEIRKIIVGNIEAWAPKKPKTLVSENFKSKNEGLKRAHIIKEREQVHIMAGYPGLTWSDNDREALEVLSNILGGQGGRLFLKLRDKQSLAYSVCPILSFGCDAGVFGTYIACAPHKKIEALDGLLREMDLLKESLSDKKDLERAKNYIIGNHYIDMQRSEAQAMTMALMELYGIGFDDFLKYPQRVESVSAEDVFKVANKILDQEKLIVVSVGNQPD